jgi:hypothetical protein
MVTFGMVPQCAPPVLMSPGSGQIDRKRSDIDRPDLAVAIPEKAERSNYLRNTRAILEVSGAAWRPQPVDWSLMAQFLIMTGLRWWAFADISGS